MSDYGAKSRQQMMARYNLERRKKWMRRQWYHATEIMGGVLWGMVAIIGFAMLIFFGGASVNWCYEGFLWILDGPIWRMIFLTPWIAITMPFILLQVIYELLQSL